MTTKTAHSAQNRVFIFMGVSGSGKSTVASKVANELSCAFLDGDFLHPKSNIMKMAGGIPLNDEDRAPWLQLINSAAYAMSRTNRTSIIVCSALKKKYRDIIREDNANVRFVYLRGGYDTIEQRLKKRKNHFYRASMLQSQFALLEEPTDEGDYVYTIDIDGDVDQVVKRCIEVILEDEKQRLC